MKKLIRFVIAICFLTACRNEKPKEETADSASNVDTLAYTYDSVQVYSKHVVKNEHGQDTAKASITYPIFKNQELNNYLNRQVLNYFSEEDQSAISYQEITKSFIQGYDSFYIENKDTPQWWFLLIDIEVLRQAPRYIALKYTHSDYTGGAHGNTNVSFLNYNPKTNQPITLDSLINHKEKEKLIRMAEAIFRKNENLSATAPLTDQYFFDNGVFTLAQNFYVSEKGLVFLYNPYEIKPYAAGATELIIPFSALKDIAKANTILTSTH